MTRQEQETPGFHRGPVSCVDMRADGTLASGGYDGRVGVWSASGRCLQWLEGHGGLVNGVAWSPDGARLASASSDGSAIVWDVARARPLQRLDRHDDDVNALAWSPDGQRLATASFDGCGRVFDVDRGDLVAELHGHGADVNGIAWSPKGCELATASDDGTAALWSTSGERLRVLEGHQDWVDDVAFSPDGSLLASASLDRSVQVFEVATGTRVAHLTGHGCTVKGVRFSPDGRLLATAAYDKRIRLFEVCTWREVARLEDARMWNRRLAWGRAGRIATGSFGSAPVQWRIGESHGRTADPFGTPGINGLAVSPSGELAALACDDGGARLVRTRDGSVVSERLDHQAAVLCTAFSPDGRRVAFGGWDDRVSIHDSGDGRPRIWIEGIGEPVNAVAFSPDGERLAVASFTGELGEWCAVTGRFLRRVGSHRGSIKQVVALPAGGWATVGRDGCVRLYRGSGSTRFELGPTIVNGIAASGDGKRLAVATRSRGVQLLGGEDGRCLYAFRAHSGSARCVALGPGGRRLAAGYYDGHVLIAEPEGGARALWRPFGATPISGVAFLDERTLLVSTWAPEGRFGRVDADSGVRLGDFRLRGVGDGERA